MPPSTSATPIRRISVGRGASREDLLHADERPFQVFRGGAGGLERGGGRGQFVALDGRQIQAPGGGAADQPRAAQIHVPDGGAHFRRRAQIHEREFMRQARLVDDSHATGALQPNGAVVFSIHVHGTVFP